MSEGVVVPTDLSFHDVIQPVAAELRGHHWLVDVQQGQFVRLRLDGPPQVIEDLERRSIELPLGPRTATVSPRSTDKSTPRNTGRTP